jgi:hypothetical protein
MIVAIIAQARPMMLSISLVIFMVVHVLAYLIQHLEKLYITKLLLHFMHLLLCDFPPCHVNTRELIHVLSYYTSLPTG